MDRTKRVRTAVADRFHLLKNLVETLERFFLHHRVALKYAAAAAQEGAPPRHKVLPHDEMYRGKQKSPQNWKQRVEEVSAQRHTEHVARYEQVRALREKGAAIASRQSDRGSVGQSRAHCANAAGRVTDAKLIQAHLREGAEG